MNLCESCGSPTGASFDGLCIPCGGRVLEENSFDTYARDQSSLRGSLVREARRVGDDPEQIRCVWLINTYGEGVETYNDKGQKNGWHLQTNTTRHEGGIRDLPGWMDEEEDSAFRAYSDKCVYITAYRSGVCAIPRHIEDAFVGCERKEF